MSPVFVFNKDWLTCYCGNEPHMSGFYACNKDGNIQHDELGSPTDDWSGTHYYCADCALVINMKKKTTRRVNA